MNPITSTHVRTFSAGRLAAAGIILALTPLSVFSQTASVRGFARVNDRFVIRPVKVVAIPRQAARSAGRPIPALVDADGEYRIESLNPGTYTLKAVGKRIRDKVVRDVNIVAGIINVNLTLEMARQRAKVHSQVLNSQGQPIKNAKVEIYSAELPASVCEKCAVAKARSNKDGEVETELAGGNDYSLAVSVFDAATKREVKMIAPNTISIGEEAQAKVKLQIIGGAQPTMTAELLRDVPLAPYQQKLAPQLANITPDRTLPTGRRTVADGIKMNLKGVVTRRDADTFIVRDMNGIDTVVRLDDETTVKTRGGFLRGGTNYGQTSILRGLNLEVEGRGNDSGELIADKVRFNESDLNVARAVESRAAPLEERASETETKLTQVEANAQRLAGQLEELAAVSNAARGGAKQAQATADAAVAGVNATNERISALDDYSPQSTAAVNFRTGSAVLTDEAKKMLDDIAGKALNAKGYVLEISGYADSRGSINLNRQLSQRRADAVIRYLVENHQIPLRRIVTPYGYGELNPVAENATREGRAQNRRVEIKLLVNKGLTSPAPTMTPNP